MTTTSSSLKHYKNGEKFESEGKFTMAINAYKKAYQYDPSYAVSIGRVYAKQGHFNWAINHYEEAGRKDPTQKGIYSLL